MRLNYRIFIFVLFSLTVVVSRGGETDKKEQIQLESLRGREKRNVKEDYRPNSNDFTNLDGSGSLLHLSDVDYFEEGVRLNKRIKKHDKERRGPKIWDQWGKWSSCTVTCGVGKITRWRHCVSGGCAPGEKEAQIKTCTLPAC